MRLPRHLRRFATGLFACVVGCGMLARGGWAQTDAASIMPDLLLEDLLGEWQAQQAALEQLRTQQHATLQAIELTRQEIATTLSRSVNATLASLDNLNELLVAQREHDLEFIRNSNRRVLTVVSCLAGLLFLTMLLVTVTSSRAMNRLTTALSASSFAPPQLTAPRPAGLLTESGAAELQTALERLEQRIVELENHAAPPTPQEGREADAHAA